ncbi:MAG: 2-amino-4-hydroxy-6-hydroxymethyldihydropteridine diphosphokinase, partial [Magnetococcales bacterium]|nr:2-amino-4-hydroxy-6-hydroxymethyldihydropteridine diphosphokinase [Magnetococcales bacterium]
MHTPVLIAFGSNIEPERHLVRGLTRLFEVTGWQAVSTVYRTTALATPDQPDSVKNPDFLNGAIAIHQPWDPLELQRTLKAIEQEMGRQPDAPRWAPRPLDLDIALMGELVRHSPNLVLPDPDMLTRPFLAVSLAQLAPAWLHPLENRPL